MMPYHARVKLAITCPVAILPYCGTLLANQSLSVLTLRIKMDSKNEDQISESTSLLVEDTVNQGDNDHENIENIAPHNHCLLHTRTEKIRFDDDATVHAEQPSSSSWIELKLSGVILLTILFFFVELIVGIIASSVALIADAYHMLSDVIALCLTLLCLRIARFIRPHNHGFGGLRADVVGALINSVFLLSMCFTIVVHGFYRLLHPHHIHDALNVFFVGLIGLSINVFAMLLLKGEGHGHSHGDGHTHSAPGHGHGHSHGGHSHSMGHAHDSHSHSAHAVLHSGEEKSSQTDKQSCEKSRLDEHSCSDSFHSDGENCSDSDSVSRENLPPRRLRDHRTRALSQVSIAVSQSRFASIVDNIAPQEKIKKRVSKKHKSGRSLNISGAFLHIMTDALGSVFVIIVAGISYFLQMEKVGAYLDAFLSLILASMASGPALRILKGVGAIIMRHPPSFLDINAIKEDIESISGVVKCHDLTVWTLSGDRIMANSETEFCSVQSYDEAMPKIRRILHHNYVHNLTLQPIFSDSCVWESEKLDQKNDSAKVEKS